MTADKTGTDAVDEAFKAVGAVRYDVFKSKFESDKKSYQADYYSQKFAEQGCGIRTDKNVDEKFNYSGATYLEKQKLVTRALYKDLVLITTWGLLLKSICTSTPIFSTT